MSGRFLEGMDPTCSLRSIDEMPPRFLDYRIVPKIQIVDHVISEPSISYPWDPKNRAVSQPLFSFNHNEVNHCFVGVFHRDVQRRYVVWVKVKRAYVHYVDDIFLIRDLVAYRIIGFITDISSGTVVDLRDLIRTKPPRTVLVRIARTNFSWRVPT